LGNFLKNWSFPKFLGFQDETIHLENLPVALVLDQAVGPLLSESMGVSGGFL